MEEERETEKVYTGRQIAIACVLLGILIERETRKRVKRFLDGTSDSLPIMEIRACAVEKVRQALERKEVPNFPDGMPQELMEQVASILNELVVCRLL